ncbi:hypothetical protein OROMI_033129 [Orobanche minor]
MIQAHKTRNLMVRAHKTSNVNPWIGERLGHCSIFRNRKT